MTWPGTDAARPGQRRTLGWALGLNGLLLPDTTPVPMEGTPRGIDSEKVPNAILAVDRVVARQTLWQDY